MNERDSSAIYLDNAATSFPKPACVNEAVIDYLTNSGAAYGRGSYAGGDESVRLVTECRQRLARLLAAPSPSDLAFTFNCTDSLNLILRGVLRDGDRVVTTTLEHNSVLRPLEQLKTEFSLEVEYTTFDPATGLINLEQLESHLKTKETKLVVVNHASNVTGVVQPVEKVSKLAHDAGALVLIDAAQTAGHLPINLKHLDADFLAAAGHKGLLGPLGTGIVYVKQGLEDQLLPIRSGGTGTNSESLIQPRSMPELLESGNMNMPGIAGLTAAAEWLLNQAAGELHTRITSHTDALRSALNEIERVKVHGDSTHANAGIVSFLIDEVDSREAALILDQTFKIQCRAGFHCAPLVHETLGTHPSGGSLRFSPGVFTTNQQVEFAANAIKQLCEFI